MRAKGPARAHRISAISRCSRVVTRGPFKLVRHPNYAAVFVELTALVGYFVMVCWVMNVARTPGPVASATSPLEAFPA
jgi:protein-S-isoprenylcysteine O-methyltransferase Ste14